MSNFPPSRSPDNPTPPEALATLADVVALRAELAALREVVAHLAERTGRVEQRCEERASAIEWLQDQIDEVR